MALPDLPFDEATRPGGTGYVRNACVVTFYRANCSKCRTITVGMASITDPNWNVNGTISCRCGERVELEMRKVDLAV